MGQIGELKGYTVSPFEMTFGILDVWAPEGIVKDVRINADALAEVSTPHG